MGDWWKLFYKKQTSRFPLQNLRPSDQPSLDGGRKLEVYSLESWNEVSGIWGTGPAWARGGDWGEHLLQSGKLSLIWIWGWQSSSQLMFLFTFPDTSSQAYPHQPGGWRIWAIRQMHVDPSWNRPPVVRLTSQQVLASQPSASFPGPLFTKYEWIASDHCLLKGFVRIKSESKIHRKREPETMEGEGNFETT